MALPGYRFGAYEVDLKSGELRKHGVKIRLQEQPFQVLVSLLQQPGQVITRDELQEKLWPSDTFVDFDHGLNAAIARLREALCDSAGSPRYIETLPRRGYRFLTAVEKLGSETAAEGRLMLAVLPFENLDGNPEQEYFADGMTEEMIAQLGRISPARLGLIARTSAMQYKHTRKTIGEISRELAVEYVLEGSVRRAGQNVRITAQLIRTTDQTHLWAESYDRTLDDVLAIQTDCAGRIARSLALELLPGQREAMTRAATQSAPAYEAYLQGRYHWNKRTEEGFRKAVEYFEKAIALDPTYAHAYVGLSDVYDLLGMFSMMPPKEAYERARAAAARALAIDPDLAEAHTSLAHGKFLYEWDWAGSERAFLTGLRLNPNHAQSHYWYALFLSAMGRFDDAATQMRQARELDPVSLVVHTYSAWVCYFSRDYDQAVERFQKALELEPGFSIASIFLGLALVQKGMPQQAVEALVKGTEASGFHPGALAALAAVYALDRNKTKSRKTLEQVQGMSGKRYITPYYLALAMLAQGDQNAALDWLERACDERSGWLAYLKVEPSMDTLRAHPRFERVLERVGLPN
jgi:TolB-like protein/lipoprotein NlpI